MPIARAAALDETRTAALLEQWESRELVRRQIDPETREAVWTLDHDYLSGGVLAADSAATRLSRLLAEADEDFRASGSNLLRRWQSLLPPAQQARLWLSRLRGEFRYGAQRTFASISLARFLPYAAVSAFVVLVGWSDVQHRRDKVALDLFDNVVTAEATAETPSLPSLRALSPGLRLRVFEHALDSVAGAEKLKNAGVLTAIVGFDPAVQAACAAKLRNCINDPRTKPAIARAAATLLPKLANVDWDLLRSAQRDEHLFAALISGMSQQQWAAIFSTDASMRWRLLHDYGIAHSWASSISEMIRPWAPPPPAEIVAAVVAPAAPPLTLEAANQLMAAEPYFNDEKFADVLKRVSADDGKRIWQERSKGLGIEATARIAAGLPPQVSAAIGLRETQRNLLAAVKLKDLLQDNLREDEGGVDRDDLQRAVTKAALAENEVYEVLWATQTLMKLGTDTSAIRRRLQVLVAGVAGGTIKSQIDNDVLRALDLVKESLSTAEKAQIRAYSGARFLTCDATDASWYASVLFGIGQNDFFTTPEAMQRIAALAQKDSRIAPTFLPVANALPESTQILIAEQSLAIGDTDERVLALCRTLGPDRFKAKLQQALDKDSSYDGANAAKALLALDPRVETLRAIANKATCLDRCREVLIEFADARLGCRCRGNPTAFVTFIGH